MLGRNKGSIFVSIIVGLAIIGFVVSLIKNPSGFLLSILVMVGIAFGIFMIVRAVMNRQSGGSSDEMRKYRKAVKQSKLKYNHQEQQKKSSNKAASLKDKKKKRHRTHLTVIDGKKSTNKGKTDRASN